MFRVLIAIAAVAVIVAAGAMAPAVGIVDGQEGGTPRPGGATPSAGICSVVGTPMPAGQPVNVATPAVAASFDIVYIDLVLTHTKRIAGVATVTAETAERDALRVFGAEIAVNLDDRSRRLEVWRSLWYGEQPALTNEELTAAVERLGEADPGRGGIPGGFEALGMSGIVDEACAAAMDDAVLIDVLIGAVDADLLLARAAVEQAEHDELRFEASAIADRDQQWLDGLIALRARWFGGVTPAASPVAFERT